MIVVIYISIQELRKLEKAQQSQMKSESERKGVSDDQSVLKLSSNQTGKMREIVL